MKRTELRRKTGLRVTTKSEMARTRLAPVSPMRKKERKNRAIVRLTVLERDGYRCRAQDDAPGQCAGPLDVHEPKTRARGGDPLDPDQCLTVCRAHHDYAHANPQWAVGVGLLLHSWDAS